MSRGRIGFLRGNSAGEGNDPRVLSRLFAPAITRSKSDKTSGFTKNAGFVAKAPEAVVEGEKAKMAKYQEMLDAVLVRIDTLK